MKYDIFISYSRKDAAIVNEVVNELKSFGFSIWIDKYGVYSGDAFKSVIVNAIDNSNTVLFFSSEFSNVSQWTTKEIAVAIYKHKRVVPIRLDESSYSAEIMFDLVNLDYIDLSNRTTIKTCVERLIKTLGYKQEQSLLNSNESVNLSKPEVNAGEKSNKKVNKFKFLLSYKGCLISIAFILVGFITLPFVFINKTQTKHIVNYPVEKSYKKQEDAIQGLADAQNDFGDCYYYGQGVTQDYAEAAKWYRKAAEQGYAADQNKLGDCYYYGRGVAQDYAEAVKWYRKAAEQGFASAQYNLGLCYYNGLGVAQDYTKAKKWIELAEQQGHEKAKEKLSTLFE